MHEAMTLGEAQELLATSWACACVGAPPGMPGPCYCQLACAQARALHRAAHIVAKLLLTPEGR